MFFDQSYGQNNESYYSIVSKMDRYYDSLIHIRGINNMQGTGFKSYIRWKEYWLTKVNPDGNIEATQTAILNYTNAFNQLKSNISKGEF